MTNRNIFNRVLLFVLVFSLFLTACGQTKSPSPAPSASPVPELVSPSPEPEPDPIAEQLAAMTTEQKVGQLLVAGIEGYAAGADAQTAIREAITLLGNGLVSIVNLLSPDRVLFSGGLTLFFGWLEKKLNYFRG